MKTYSAKAGATNQEWYIVDASDKILGRLASQIALRLRGKHKAIYTPHVDTGEKDWTYNISIGSKSGSSRRKVKFCLIIKQIKKRVMDVWHKHPLHERLR